MNRLLASNTVRVQTVKAMLRFKRRMMGHPDSSRSKNANRYNPSNDRSGGERFWNPLTLPSDLATFVHQEQLRVDAVSLGHTDATWGRWRHGAGPSHIDPDYLEAMKIKRQQGAP